MKLRTRILLSLLLVALLPMAVAGYWIVVQMERLMDEDTIADMRTIADARIEMVSHYLHDTRSNLTFMQSSPLLRRNLPILHDHIDQPDSPAFRGAATVLQDIFGRMHTIYGYSHILLLDQDGRLVCFTGTALPDQHIGRPLPASFGFIPDKQGKGIYQSPTFLDERNGHYHLLMAAAISDGHGRRIGTLLLAIEALDILGRMQALPSFGESGEILLGIQTGNDIQFMTPLKFGAGHDPSEKISQSMRLALQGKKGSGYVLDYRGREVLAAWNPMPETNWGMVVKIDTDEARAPIVHIRNMALLTLLLTGLLASLAATGVARSVIRPIGRIQQASRMIGSGNLGYRVGAEEKDEIGELSRSLDEMSDKLKLAMEEQGRLVNILDATPDLVGMARMDGSIMYINPAGRRMIGIDDGAADPLTLNISEMHPEWARKPLLEEGIPAAIRDGVWTRETVLLARNGMEIPVLQTVLSHPGEDGNPAYVSTTMHDLRKLRELEGQTKKGRQALTTINRNLEEQVRKNKEVTQQLEHKMAEDDKTRQAMLLMLDDLNVSNAEVRKTNRALKLLSKCNGVLVHAEKEEDFLAEICKLAVETGGYMMAWIGFVEHDAARTVRPVAQSGYEDGYLEHIDITWADTERGQGPAGTAIRSQTTVINEDSLTNPNMAPWREDAIKRGYRSSIALPLTDRSRVPLGIFSLYAKEPHAFGEEEVVLLEELANEISYGITSLRTRIAHEQHTVVLRQSLEQSIQAIADTVEARDPYTAGHQRGVADLAVAIAREMRLTEDRIHGIHLAANIHDLGKIHVPAEILSKPGRLTEIEHQLIRTHPQAGYDIVKGIEFPWPIAQMILQHHEKMDGSGYPQGLKGEQILPESRIIAVADVVEAMSSHRPYRVGLGLDAALEEIERHRGVLYDPETVDACIRLFREQGYQLPAASPRPA